jgi:hypothetical protein
MPKDDDSIGNSSIEGHAGDPRDDSDSEPEDFTTKLPVQTYGNSRAAPSRPLQSKDGMLEWIETCQFQIDGIEEKRVLCNQKIRWKGVEWTTLLIFRPLCNEIGVYLGIEEPHKFDVPLDWIASTSFRYTMLDYSSNKPVDVGKSFFLNIIVY